MATETIPNSPPPVGVALPADYTSLQALNGTNIVTTDESSVQLTGTTDAASPAEVIAYVVPYEQELGKPLVGTTAEAATAPVAVTDAGTKDASGNELSNYTATLSTAGLTPGIYTVETYLAFNIGGTTYYEDGGVDGKQIISIEAPGTQQTTVLHTSATSAELSRDGRYLVYTEGDTFERDLQTGANVDLTATGKTAVGQFATNGARTVQQDSSGNYFSYPIITRGNEQFSSIPDFDVNPNDGADNPLPVVTNQTTGVSSVLGGIGTPKYQVGFVMSASDSGGVVLTADPDSVRYLAQGASFATNPDPQIFVTDLGAAPTLSIDTVNGASAATRLNTFDPTSHALTISGQSNAVGQSVEIDVAPQTTSPDQEFGTGTDIGTTAVDNTGHWSLTVDPTKLGLQAGNIFVEASVSSTGGVPAQTYDVLEPQGSTTAPLEITGVETSIPAGSTFGPGQPLTITLDTSAAATVTNAPALVLSNGTFATYVSGSGTQQLQFVYNPTNVDHDASDLGIQSIQYPANATILANGQSLQTGTFPTPLNLDLQVLPIVLGVDPKSSADPTTSSSTTPIIDVSAEAGQTVTLMDNQEVIGTGTAPVTGTQGIETFGIQVGTTPSLSQGANPLTAISTAPNGIATGSSATYTVTVGQATTTPPPAADLGDLAVTLDPVLGYDVYNPADPADASAVISGTTTGTVSSVNLTMSIPGYLDGAALFGTHADVTQIDPAHGTWATAFPALTDGLYTAVATIGDGTGARQTASEQVLVDTFQATSATLFAGITSSATGHVVGIALHFDQPVTVVGSPTLDLSDGGTATYSAGFGTNALVFNYTPGAETTADLQITGISVPTGSAIVDGNGTPLPTNFTEDLGIPVNEAASVLTVTNANDSGAGSLRAALAAAKSGDTIDFDASVDGATITLASTLTITNGVTIDGTGDGITVNGNDAFTDFFVDNASPVATTIKGLTITGGNGAGLASTSTDDRGDGDTGGSAGGGITLQQGTLDIEGDQFTNDKAVGGTGANYDNNKDIKAFGGTGGSAAGGVYVGAGTTLDASNDVFNSDQATGGSSGTGGKGYGQDGGGAAGGIYVEAGATVDAFTGLTFNADSGTGGPAINTDPHVTSGGPGGSFANTNYTGPTTPTGGNGQDGYIVGATVAYENGSGPSTTTDAQGNFKLTGGTGPIVMTGGTDSATGLPFTGSLIAPAGSTIVSPLTTLLESVAEARGDTSAAGIAKAQAAILTAFGLPQGIDLTSFDAEAAAPTPGGGAYEVYAADTFLVSLSRLVDAAGGSTTAALGAVAKAIADGQTIDLTNPAIFVDAAGLSSDAAAAVLSIAKATLSAVVAQVNATTDPSAIFTDLTAGGVAIQRDAVQALQNAGGNLSAAAATFNDSLAQTLANDASEAAGAPTAATVSNEIALLYQTVLGRAADPQGLANFLTLADQGGVSLASEAAAMIASPEAVARYDSQSDSQFVTQLLTNADGATPTDPGSMATIAQLTQDLGQGAFSRGEIAVSIALEQQQKQSLAAGGSGAIVDPGVTGAITTSPTSPGGIADLLASTLFGSAPSAVDLESDAQVLATGGSPADLAAQLLSSPAYAQQFGSQTDTQFIDQLYANALGRTPDPSGLAGFTTALAGGASRASVAVAIALSPEHDADTAGTFSQGIYVPDATGSSIARLYQAILGRAPDPLGEANFVHLAQQGGSLTSTATAMINSSEAGAQFANATNAQFVTALYQNALGRAPDASGFDSFVDALGGGASRAAVATAIAESPEAIRHLAPQIENGFRLS